MSLSQRIRDTTAELWAACAAHPFVEAVGIGDVEQDVFRRYLVQDYLLLADIARVLALASARSPDIEMQTRFARIMHSTIDVEMDMHRRICREWSILPSDLDRAEPAPHTLAYGSFLVRTASAGDYGEIAASLLPRWWTAADIGSRLAAEGLPEHEPRLTTWIRTYADGAYAELAGWLRSVVDRAGASADDATYLRWRRTVKTALGLELAILDASLPQGPTAT